MTGSPDPSPLPAGLELSPALAKLSGTVLEQRYELGRVLGAGGMGAVFEAKHLRLDRTVAIKVLHPMYSDHGEYTQRFLREAKAASKIRHRNVVEILDFGEAAGGLVYTVMELLLGQDLQRVLRFQPNERLPWVRAHRLLLQIASGLKAAHACGVIHRDVKPANCFLTQEDGEPVVKLVDFGIAKVESTEHEHRLTGTAQLLGTPYYVAPEVIRGDIAVSPRSDMYSMGILAYRMLVGTVPFTGNTVFEVLRQSCFEPVPSLRERVPDVPVAAEALILDLLAKAPDDRPRDMGVVRQRLLGMGQPGTGAIHIPPSGALPIRAASESPPTRVIAPPVPADPGDTDVSPTVLDAARVTRTEVVESPSSELRTVAVVPPAGGGPIGSDSGSAPVHPGEPVSDAVSGPLLTGDTVQDSVSGPLRVETPVQDSASGPVRTRGVVPDSFSGSSVRAQPSPARGRPVPRPVDDGSQRLWWWALGLAVVATMVSVLVIREWVDDDDDDAAMRIAASPAVVSAETPAPAVLAVPRASEPVVVLAHPSPADGEVGVPVDEPVAEVEPVAEPEVELATEPEVEEPEVEEPEVEEPMAGVEPSAPKAPRPASEPSKPVGPPSDAVLIKKIKRRIKSKCAPSMGGKPVTVSFLVRQSGKIMGLTTSPMNDAGRCAARRVEGTEFRPRRKNTPVKLTVK